MLNKRLLLGALSSLMLANSLAHAMDGEDERGAGSSRKRRVNSHQEQVERKERNNEMSKSHSIQMEALRQYFEDVVKPRGDDITFRDWVAPLLR